MATTAFSVADTCAAAKRASRTLATVSSAVKDAALEAIAATIEEHTGQILDANVRDLEAASDGDYSSAFLDKLRLDEARVASMAAGVRKIVSLPDPVGEVIDGWRLANGLDVRKVRVPLGVVAVVYEARPNVTIDATALCLKSGNAVVLRGSSAAARSNAVLAQLASSAASAAGLPEDAISLLQGGREDIAELATQNGTVDLIVPRGGEGLKASLKGVATVPVIYAASGNCHVYVDASADLDAAQAIVLNAKLQRPGVCNAAETLLVHSRVAGSLLPGLLRALSEAGVTLHGDDRARAAAAGVPIDAASEEDWDTEYLALELAVGVVDSV
ncbi:MAG TPA: glutamate-5-semialdehyde dehydrogenase, partial [Solirubrobacteraceae bacterium]|nr:glutamate-5-semialdehyde dehydrogenase [Solirubrobacteraceae bacterium]